MLIQQDHMLMIRVLKVFVIILYCSKLATSSIRVKSCTYLTSVSLSLGRIEMLCSREGMYCLMVKVSWSGVALVKRSLGCTSRRRGVMYSFCVIRRAFVWDSKWMAIIREWKPILNGPDRSGERRENKIIPHDIVLASRASGHLLDTQTLKNHPSGHPNYFVKNFLKCHSHAFKFFFVISQFPWHCIRISCRTSISL